uniref:Calmodulin-lysine N-methyltransferase n=1 Tax=Panagrellus redivivus TaxID=6233 RepID=A0A7E4V5K1_PANRE
MSDEIQVIEKPEASSPAVPVDPIAKAMKPIVDQNVQGPPAAKKLMSPATKEKAKRRWIFASNKINTNKKARSDEPENADNIPEATYGLYSLTQLDDPENDDKGTWMTLKWNAGMMPKNTEQPDAPPRVLPDVIVRMLSSNNLPVEVLQGFNNTGNVRIWPSEECLAWIIATGYGDRFKGKKVLELGCGMTALASICASYFAESVVASDGSEIAVANAAKCIARNNRQNVTTVCHKWGEAVAIKDLYAFDYIIAGDCLFEQENIEAFVKTVEQYLASNGNAFIVSPERGGSLLKFIEKVKDLKLIVEKRDLCPVVAERLAKLKTDKGEAFDATLDLKVVVIRRPTAP